VYILTIIYRALSLMQCQKLSVYRYENINSLETELLIKHIKTLPNPLAVEIQTCGFSIPAVEHLQKASLISQGRFLHYVLLGESICANS